jgi:hypothetical protein
MSPKHKTSRQEPTGSFFHQWSFRILLIGLSLMAMILVKTSFNDPMVTKVRTKRSQNRKALRIFGPASFATMKNEKKSSDNMSYQFATRAEQRAFVAEYGSFCQRGFAASMPENLILSRFDSLPSEYGTELWKFCMLYTGLGNVYWQADNMQSLLLLEELLVPDQNAVVQMERNRIHHSFMQVAKHNGRVPQTMMRILVESKNLDPIRYADLLGMHIAKDKLDWVTMEAQCSWSGDVHEQVADQRVLVAQHCPTLQACCQVWHRDSWPVLTIRHPFLAPAMTYQLATPFRNQVVGEELAMPVEELAYIATVREVVLDTDPTDAETTPNFFDILIENSCLPEHRDCFRCLKSFNEGEYDCTRCQVECPCYCKALCNVRPPPKRLAAEWLVRLPQRRKDNRLIPRIIHQTWYEPITKEKYPNMSRLIASFQQSGWTYEFYDDDRAAQFLSTHFPPQVRHAYDSILPGAFKADLFRYCVLLIRGGVYADMDIVRPLCVSVLSLVEWRVSQNCFVSILH